MGIFEWIRTKAAGDQSKPALQRIPQHVAIIMDGNGRWAQHRGLPRSAGHRAGLDRVRDAVEFCAANGVKYLTLFAFSTENWRRPTEEVEYLMKLFEEALKKEIAKLHENGIRIRFIGLREEVSPSLQQLMTESERLTKNNQTLVLNIAINYGGRSELVTAARRIAEKALQGELQPQQITEEQISKHLFTAGQPDPDLLIKPGGELRISNFLIWQMAYTEFYFSELMWPDFKNDELYKAFRDYSQRKRRFGKVKGE